MWWIHSLVPRPVRAIRVTRGGLEPSAIGEFSRQAWQVTSAVTSHPKSPRTTGNEAGGYNTPGGLFLKSSRKLFMFTVFAKLSVNEAKLSGFWARNCAPIQQVLILKFALGPHKLPASWEKRALVPSSPWPRNNSSEDDFLRVASIC